MGSTPAVHVFLWLVVLCCTPSFAAASEAPPPEAAPARHSQPPAGAVKPALQNAREAAVAQARKGNIQKALADLKRLHEANPKDPAVLYDYVVVNCWAGRYAEASSLSLGLRPELVPEYVAQAVAAALRKNGNLSKAQRWYDVGAARFPANADIALGRALTLGDRGRAARGLGELTAYSLKFPVADAKAVALGKTYLRRQIAAARPKAAPARPDAPYRAEQDAAVAMARDGNVPAGLAVIEKLYNGHSTDQYLLGDYLFLLQWNKENDKAVEYSSRLRLAAAPAYAVEAGARALASARKVYGCEKLLEEALAAQRRNPELLVTAAVVFADIGDDYRAVSLLDEAEHSRAPGLEKRIAAARESMGYNRIAAMKDLRYAVKTKGAGASKARQGVPDGLSAVGGSLEARDIAGALPYVSSERYGAIAVAASLESVFLGQQSAIPRNLAERERELRASLRLLDGLGADPECGGDCLLQRDIARIQPLEDLGLAREAAAQYEAVKDRVTPLPPAAQLAAAGAYMRLQEPDKARDIYAAVIAAKDGYTPAIGQDDLYKARNGLFWAYLENEQLAEALVQAESVRESALYPTDGRAPFEDTDWKKLDADLTLGYAWLYTDAFDKAENHFRELADAAPASSEAQSGLAATYIMRGLPRTALEGLESARIFAPDDINLAAHEADARLDAKDWRAARSVIDGLKDYAPYSDDIRRLERRWKTHSLYELRLEGNWDSPIGHTLPGTSSRTQTPSLEWRLYSPPLGYDWRLYGGASFARARYDEGLARQFLSLAGVEYRVPWVTANLEARYDDSGSDDVGAALYGALTPGDRWSFPFSFEAGSRDTPLRARNEGITADSYSMGVGYYWNESRSARISAEGMSFSDGNQRLGLDAGLTQRLWRELTHYLDGSAGIRVGGNSKEEDRPYFNPKSEAELDGSLTYGAVLWRRYDKALSHAVTAGIGGYAQRDQGALPVLALGYSQDLDWTDRFSASYGLGFERRPYDGEQENDLNVFFNLSWKF